MKGTLMASVDQKDLDYFNEIKKKAKSEGKMVSAVFHEFVDAHKEKYEGELK